MGAGELGFEGRSTDAGGELSVGRRKPSIDSDSPYGGGWGIVEGAVGGF